MDAAAPAPVRINLNEQETELIQQTFTEDLLKTMRALFLGLDVTDADRAIIKTTFANDALRAVVWKRFLPSLDRNTPIGQVQDTWLGTEQMVFGQPRDTIAQAVAYKAESIAMTRQALNLLENPSGSLISLDILPADDTGLQIGLLARNQFIRHIESQLQFLWVIASQKKGDAKSNAQDSAK